MSNKGKQSMSIAQKTRYHKPHSIKTRNKMSKSKQNMSEMTRLKMSIAAKNRWKHHQ